LGDLARIFSQMMYINPIYIKLRKNSEIQQ